MNNNLKELAKIMLTLYFVMVGAVLVMASVVMTFKIISMALGYVGI